MTLINYKRHHVAHPWGPGTAVISKSDLRFVPVIAAFYATSFCIGPCHSGSRIDSMLKRPITLLTEAQFAVLRIEMNENALKTVQM